MSNKIVEIITANLMQIMQQKNLSCSDLAKLCNISTSSLSRIINKQVNTINITTLITLANALSIDYTLLLDGIESQCRAETKNDPDTLLFAAILTKGDKRITRITNSSGSLVGESTLSGHLVVTHSPTKNISLISESITDALNNRVNLNGNYKSINLAITMLGSEVKSLLEKFETVALKKFNKIHCLADWEVNHSAAFKTAPGISLILDKGIAVAYRDNNIVRNLGGWGFPFYDQGGEHWLGLMAVRHVIRVHENFEKKSYLSQNILSKFDGKLSKVIEYCAEQRGFTNIRALCVFSDVVLKCYSLNCEKSEELLRRGFIFIQEYIDKIDSISKQKMDIYIDGTLAPAYKKFIPATRLLAPIQCDQKLDTLLEVARLSSTV